MIRMSSLLVMLVALWPTWVVAQAPVSTGVRDGFVYYQAEQQNSYQSSLARPSVSLSDGTRAELWQFRGERGDCVTISMSSNTFLPSFQVMRGSPQGPVVQTEPNRERYANVTASLPPLGATDSYFILARIPAGLEHGGEYTLSLRGC